VRGRSREREREREREHIARVVVSTILERFETVIGKRHQEKNIQISSLPGRPFLGIFPFSLSLFSLWSDFSTRTTFTALLLCVFDDDARLKESRLSLFVYRLLLSRFSPNGKE
jgi:hypothetical protein